MLKLPEQELSYWLESSAATEYPPLKSDLDVDVAVVGGGMAGLSAAYLLKRAGLAVAVLEKGRLGGMVSGHTTGKVTSQHNLVYTKLQSRLGTRRARDYGEANQAAIDQIEQIIKREKIDCDWQRDDNYVFTQKSAEVGELKQEAEVAKALGLPASFETTTPLPFAVAGAVRFANQAKMHTRKYLLGLAKAVHGGGSYVFEQTAATSVRDRPSGSVRTKVGDVRAKYIIIATNVPFPLWTHGVYCALEYPLKSYIVAARVEQPLQGMYITPSDPLISILPITSGKEHLLLVGGSSHIPYLGRSDKHYQELADFAEAKLNLPRLDWRWAAWDYLGYDSMPLIGKLYPWSRQLYVATGFMKWGLTNTTAGAMILSDLIQGKANPWAKTFRPQRWSPILSIPRVAWELISG